MAEPTGDPLLLPTWIQAITMALVAVVSGVVGSASSALLIALGINRKFSELDKSFILGINALRLHVDNSDSQRFHNVMNIVQAEMGKSEANDMELGRRIGACEQDLAVMEDFKKRVEAFMVSANAHKGMRP